MLNMRYSCLQFSIIRFLMRQGSIIKMLYQVSHTNKLKFYISCYIFFSGILYRPLEVGIVCNVCGTGLVTLIIQSGMGSAGILTFCENFVLTTITMMM